MKKRWTNIKLAATIAFTHMRAKLKQTLIATAGVAFGITAFIFLLGMIKGIQGFLKETIFEQSPQVHLYNEIKLSDQSLLDQSGYKGVNMVLHRRPKAEQTNLKNGFHALQEIRKDSRVKAAAPSVQTQVFYNPGAISINGQINGINYEASNRLFHLGDKSVAGSFDALSTIPNSIVMGIGLADKMNVQVGDNLVITTKEGNNFDVKIIGIFQTGLTAIDNNQSYADLKTVQNFLHQPSSYITDIEAKLYDNEIAPQVSRDFQKRFDYSGSNWKIDNATFLQGQVLQNIIAYGVAIVILLVAGFGIYNILTMMIYEKMKDISILKATGYSDKDVRRIFMIQALLIGLVGAIVGLILGYLACVALTYLPYESDTMITMDHLPVSFNPVFYITAFCFGVITTALAGFMPSRKAAKLDPITVLRG